MKTPPGYLFVALAGVGLYALAAFAPLFVLPDFWTRSTIGSEIPWYFIGQAFIEGVAAAVAFLLCAILGAVAARRYGAAAWGALMPAFLDLYSQFDPDTTGGAMLLGLNGVCIISHGSSSARAMVNGIKVARDMVQGDIVEKIRAAVAVSATS